MKKIALALALALAVTPAASQTQFPADTVWGNVGPNTALPTPIVVPDCPLGVLSYTLGVGFSCVTISASGGIVGINSPGQTLTVGGGAIVAIDINLAHANVWTGTQTINDLHVLGNGCLQASAVGVVTTTGSPCGSGAGSITSTAGTLTISGSTNIDIALGHSNTWTASQNTTINQNAQLLNLITNTDPGTNASATLGASNGTGSVFFGMSGANYTSAGPLVTNRGFVFSSDADLVLSTATANAVIIGTSLTERARFTSTGLIVQPGVSTGTSTLAVNQDWSVVGPFNLIAAFTSYGDSSRITARRANGTQAAPTALTTNDVIATFGARGYGANGGFTTGNVASVNMFAGEPFNVTTGAFGSYMTFSVFGLLGAVNPMGVPLVISATGVNIQGASPSPAQPLFADAPLTINANTVGSPLVGLTDTNLHIIGADGHLSRILMDTFGSNAFGSLLEVRAAGGTATLPTGTPAGTSLFGLIAFGHNGTTFNNNGPAIAMVAAEAFDATHAGANITFQTTAMGTRGGTQVMRIQPSGGLSVGSANVGTDGGDGGLVASTVLVRGLSGVTNLAYLKSAAGASSFISIDTGSAGTGQAGFNLYDNGVNKWQFIKQTDNSFLIYDAVGAISPIVIAPSGNMSLNPKGTVRIDASGGLTIGAPHSGSFNLATAAIGSGACTGVQSVAVADAVVNDAVVATFGFDPTSTVGYAPSVNGMLTIITWASAGFVNFKVCNNTAAAITPGGMFIPWRLIH